jgi:hypothetical protein
VKRGNSILADLPDGHLPIAARGGACPTPGDQRNSTNSVDANASFVAQSPRLDLPIHGDPFGDRYDPDDGDPDHASP